MTNRINSVARQFTPPTSWTGRARWSCHRTAAAVVIRVAAAMLAAVTGACSPHLVACSAARVGLIFFFFIYFFLFFLSCAALGFVLCCLSRFSGMTIRRQSPGRWPVGGAHDPRWRTGQKKNAK